jgi:CO/xanthine dehydrogenase Mo-binding subunit
MIITNLNLATNLSRRDLLKTGGALVVSFALSGRAFGQSGPTAADRVPAKSVDPTEVDGFLAVHADGFVTVYTGKVDVGTGLRIAIAQMAAEELGVSAERVKLIDGDTSLTPDQGATGGSTGLTRGGADVRQAAATARQAILNLAAVQLNRPAAELTTSDGRVRPKAGGEGVTIGVLVGDKRLSLKVDPKAPLQSPATYTVVGKPLARPDVPGKCTARHTYLQDVVVPGMLHGRVVRPPAAGAKLLSVDVSSVVGIPDVRIVQLENFLAVVAADEWAAVKASRSLKATWSEGTELSGSEDLDRWVRSSPTDGDQEVVNKGDTASAMASAARKLSVTYFWPNQGHASLAPSCAVADVKSGSATVWSATQGPHALRTNLAKLFGFPPDQVRVVYTDSSGSYGGNGNDDAAADAFLLSKTIGRPVRVQWMRADEHGWDPKGPQQLLDLRAGLDRDGRIVAWEAETWVPGNRPGGRAFLALEAAGMSQDHGRNAGLMTQNIDPPYAASNVRVIAHPLKDTPLVISNLRAPGKVANVFAVESFVDELAVAAGMDPVAYRLRGLSDPRAIDVIKRAADMIGWQPRAAGGPQPPERGARVGRGFAYARYKQSENYVAMAMEAAVDRSTGKVTVQRVTCAHDCGLIVNPDSLRNQVEGLIVQTISRALHEEARFDQSRVTSTDWVSYPVLRFPELPVIEVALIDRPELPLVGAGEAAAVTVPAALANAIFDATGVRLRRAPFTPERVKVALQT